MKTRFMKRAVAGTVAAAAVLLAGTAQAALQNRDLDGDTIVDAFYDTDLDITWWREAGYGEISWVDAVDSADAFTVRGYSDWRLPTSDTCAGYNCTGSEMGHLWCIELANTAGSMTLNTGDFHMGASVGNYWSGPSHSPTR